MRQIGDLIHQKADEIGAVESRDTGKPLGQATAEVALGGDFFTYFATHAELPDGRTHPADAGYFVYSKREPYGVVGAICPWNYPFLLACWKTAPALAVGNSIVLKMAEQSPLSTSHLARLVARGRPAGGRLQRRPRRRADDRRRPRRAPAGAQADVHGLDRRQGDPPRQPAPREERPPGARRQDPEHHLRRRRPRPGDRRLPVHELLQHRPDLHERHAASRPAQPRDEIVEQFVERARKHPGRRSGRRRRSSGRSSARSRWSA